MHKELEYIELNFTEEDLDYVEEIIKKINSSSKEIVEFFELNEFGQKVVGRFWNSLDEFRKYYLEITKQQECQDYICGFRHAINGIEYIEILSLEEYRKTKSHENGTIEDLCYLVLHEFTHACHRKYVKEKCYLWLLEGCATTISHQFEKFPKTFRATLEQMKSGGASYNYYHAMFYYVFKTYGRKYILDLMKDFELLEKETPRLYEETNQNLK